MSKARTGRQAFTRNFITLIGLGRLLPKIDKCDYFWRIMREDYLWVRVVPGDFNIPRHVVRIFRSYVRIGYYFMRRKRPGAFDLTPFELYDLVSNVTLAVSKSFTKESMVYKQAMPILEEVELVSDESLDAFRDHINYFQSLLSTPESFTYYSTFTIAKVNNPRKDAEIPFASQITISLFRHAPDRRTLTLDGKKRTLYRLEFGEPWGGSFCGTEISIDGHLFDAYIQGHALRRLEERLDSITKENIYSFLAKFLHHKETISYNDTLLVPFYIGASRVGYFVVEIHNNYALLKTFLFLTHDSTPEGDLLNRELNVNKLDKAFLKLDTLSDFTHSDLQKDACIMAILKRCNLDHLHTVFIFSEINAHYLSGNAEFLRDMLQLQENPLAEAELGKDSGDDPVDSLVHIPQMLPPTSLPTAIKELYCSPMSKADSPYANVRIADPDSVGLNPFRVRN